MVLPKTLRLRDGRGLVIRHARPDDADASVQYLETVAGETNFLSFGPMECGINAADQRHYLATLEARQRDLLILGLVDGAQVGAASISFGHRPRVAHIGELGLSVLRSHWGLGVGRQLCESAFSIANQRGARKINLRVSENNTRAMALYERLGFRREGVQSRGLAIGGLFSADVLMGIEID